MPFKQGAEPFTEIEAERCRHAEADTADGLAATAARRLHERVGRIDKLLRSRHKLPALFRERHGMSAALDQANAEMFFKSADLPRDRRLCKPSLRRHSRERADLADANKSA